MSRRPIFDVIRRLLGRGLRQREVDAIDAAIDAVADPDMFAEDGPSDPNVTGRPRQIGPEGIALIKRFEGYARLRPDGRCEAYPDPGSPLARTGSGSGAPWTIGWGATGPGIGPGTIWTQEECDARLTADLLRYAAEVDAALDEAPTSQHQFDALVSFHYNTGAIARATLTRRHRSGDFAGAAAEFARWNRAGGHVLKGLMRRRAAEAALYLSRKQPRLQQEPASARIVGAEPGDKQMVRLIGVAALMLAATSPALAQGKGADDRGQGGGKPDHAAMDHGPGGKAERTAKSRGNGGAPQLEGAREGRGADKERPDKMARDAQHERGEPARVSLQRSGEGGGDRAARDSRWVERDRFVERERFYADVPSCPPGLAKKNTGCLPPGLAGRARDESFGFAYRPALFGIPLPASVGYVYHDGYLIPSQGVGPFLPLLGGALTVGQVWPETYPTMRLSDWQQDYYGFDDPNGYRYADNVLYQVDPTTSAIEAIAALLTGSDIAVGRPVPEGYDVYNVPAAFRDEYSDSDEALYRYADGRVFEVDPTTMLIEQIIDLVA